jgi:hypothetical protein
MGGRHDWVVQELDDYMEKLYEDSVDAKVTATAKISQLFRNADYLEELLSHDALLGVRVGIT